MTTIQKNFTRFGLYVLLAAIFISSSVGLSSWLISGYHTHIYRRDIFASTMGTVLDRSFDGATPRNPFKIKYRFHPNADLTINLPYYIYGSTTVDSDTYYSLHSGKSAAVRYDPKDPRDSYIDYGPPESGIVIILGLAAMGLTVMFFIVAFCGFAAVMISAI